MMNEDHSTMLLVVDYFSIEGFPKVNAGRNIRRQVAD